MPTPSGTVLEIPIATTKLANGMVVPVGGGAYLRLLPYRYTAAGIRRINERERRPLAFICTPGKWTRTARLASGLVSRLRTYVGLRSMESKLDRLMTEFSFSTIGAVYCQEMGTAVFAGSRPRLRGRERLAAPRLEPDPQIASARGSRSQLTPPGSQCVSWIRGGTTLIVERDHAVEQCQRRRQLPRSRKLNAAHASRTVCADCCRSTSQYNLRGTAADLNAKGAGCRRGMRSQHSLLAALVSVICVADQCLLIRGGKSL